MRGYFLYKYLEENEMTNVVLKEVSCDGVAQLRPHTPSMVEPHTPSMVEPQAESKRKPTTLFEFLWGISEKEYNECVDNFAKLHRTTKEDWGL